MYIQIYQIHGLIRGKNLELGLDEDTGGQIVYVMELAHALANLQEVTNVEIVTRLFNDDEHTGYSMPFEHISDKLGIVRVPCGPSRYIKKVDIWKYLDEFYDNIDYYTDPNENKPDIIHSNYVDSGYICNKLSKKFNIPHIFTAHSLGKPKFENLKTKSLDINKLDSTYVFSKRIPAEQKIIDNAGALVVSCDQEKLDQYSLYNIKQDDPKFKVITPGVNAKKFKPYWENRTFNKDLYDKANKKILDKINSQLDNPDLPPILMLGRLEAKKNFTNMIECYIDDKELQRNTNLIICAGKTTERSLLSKEQLNLLTNIEQLIKNNNLERKVCLIDEVDYQIEVPELYRVIGSKKGIFVDCDTTDPLPFSIIEAAISGIPVVAHNTCALLNVISKGKSELLINVRKHHLLSGAIFKLINNKELWEHCSKAGVECILNELTWDVTGKKMFNMYQEVIRNYKK
ncbi:MAG: glycosyltransferase [Vampirovibrionia bacterium]